ncbi:F-box protein CPR1-like isoform X2 [Rosa rugosa]|uniref:F-box protein CPR1-like isoform X2 n=1 Tax=Rosa rugosa TaxID=74645 RepID=UPI002B40FE26|nr:F-box protein CPR1-like isoform X2 [Rosa rugosa]
MVVMASPKATPTTMEDLPIDILMRIFDRLSLKLLIQFSCASKRWRSLVVSNPQFAKSYFKLKKLLLATSSQLESLNLEKSSFGDYSSVRKLTCPFKQPAYAVNILGSCNDLDLSKTILCLHHCGFGYVSATDDYKVVVAAHIMNSTMPLEIFSSRAGSWRRIVCPPHFSSSAYMSGTRGTFTNEALHWLQKLREPELDAPGNTITAFDLAKEEFRQMPLPLLGETSSDRDCFFSDIGIVFEGCLCVSSFKRQRWGAGHRSQYVQLWVMMEYGVCDSWTKLFRFEMDDVNLSLPICCTERMIVMSRYKRRDLELIRFDHDEEKLDNVAVCSSGRYTLKMGLCEMIDYDETLLWLPDSRAEGGDRKDSKPNRSRNITVEVGDCDMIKYDETLLWLNDHLGVEENVQRLGTQHEASASRNVEE